MTVKELARKVLDRAGSNVPIQHGKPLVGDIREFDVDNELITKELGIEFEKDFDRGLGHTLDWAMVAHASGLIR